MDPTVWGNFRFPSELDAGNDPVAAKNRFAFTGYLWDKETNLFFAKARFYDPEVGRFISQDSYLGQVDDPPSLHRYFYANDNPTRYVDPTGHDAEAANPTEDPQEPPSPAEVRASLEADFAKAREARLARERAEPEVITEETTDNRSFGRKALDCVGGGCSAAAGKLAKDSSEAALKKGLQADRPMTPEQQTAYDTLVASGHRPEDAEQYVRHFGAEKAALAEAGGEGVGLATQGATEVGIAYVAGKAVEKALDFLGGVWGRLRPGKAPGVTPQTPAAKSGAVEIKPGQVASEYPRGRRVGGRGEGLRVTDPPAGTRESGAFDLTPDNLAKMEKGRPPIGRDGLRVELHHSGQNPAGPLDELSSRTHDTVAHPGSPSQIDRGRFAGERARYWRARARELLGQSQQ